VEVVKYFVNNGTKYSNIVADSEIYTFKTLNGSGFGDEDKLGPLNPNFFPNNENQPDNALNYYQVYPSIIQAPGFEVIILVAAIIIVALIFKKKKKDEKKKK
jgi:hypothetical protein